MRSVREANTGYNTKIQLSLFVSAAGRGSWRRLQRWPLALLARCWAAYASQQQWPHTP